MKEGVEGEGKKEGKVAVREAGCIESNQSTTRAGCLLGKLWPFRIGRLIKPFIVFVFVLTPLETAGAWHRG